LTYYKKSDMLIQ